MRVMGTPSEIREGFEVFLNFAPRYVELLITLFPPLAPVHTSRSAAYFC